MPKNEPPADGIDWRLTTWDGSRREQLRRWAALPLERVILAIEEMQDLTEHFQRMHAEGGSTSASGGAARPQATPNVREPPPPSQSGFKPAYTRASEAGAAGQARDPEVADPPLTVDNHLHGLETGRGRSRSCP